MYEEKFLFEELPDLVTPKELIEKGYPGGKNAVYALFNRRDFPKIRHGKKFLISKNALMQYFKAN